MLYLALAGVTSVSTLPLRLGIIAGFITSGLAFLQILYVLVVRWRGDPVPGWASLAGLVALLFGMNFILLGSLGIYVGHIFGRVQNHPPYLIERRAPERDAPTRDVSAE
jgi:dolichol-phosphate mannosyltransferase